MQLEIIIPVLMSCLLLWWIGRGMGWTIKLAVVAVTLAIVAGILLIERGLN
jgi:ABC-type amino acid transport system permease subunit